MTSEKRRQKKRKEKKRKNVFVKTWENYSEKNPFQKLFNFYLQILDSKNSFPQDVLVKNNENIHN